MDLVLQSFSIILLLIIILNMFVETFTNSPILIYKIEMSKQKLYILNDDNYELKKYINNINNIVELNSRMLSNFKENVNTLKVKDILQIDPKIDHIITVIPEKKYVVFMTIKFRKPIETLKDAMRIEKHIVCSSKQNDINLMTFLVKLTNSNYSLISHQQDLLKELLKGNVIMLFDTLNNIRKIIGDLPNNTFEFIEFEYDINLLKVKYPHIYSENIDMSILFKNYKSRFPMKKLLVFDLFLTAEKNTVKGFEVEVYELVSNIKIVDQNNYYMSTFSYVYPTIQYLQRYNEYIQNRDNVSILEQYVDYTPKANVNGYYNSKDNILSPGNIEDIDGVPLENNTFTLKNQVREEENGTYKYERGFLIKKVEKKSKDTGVDSRYRCYGDPSINNMALCNSALDEIGNPKKKLTVWDRPCETNAECPFYQSNKTYKNYRGGCNDGYCEFPLGITRTSYRYYDKRSKPVCHNCPGDNIYCCDNETYNQKANNDYAFVLDIHERTAQGIK